MILILGYNNTESEFLNSILEELNLEYRYSLIETKIMKADKLILPHPQNFNATFRRMQMMNLFSFLRMINKPILGINDGFCMMCNQIVNKYKCGLGFFNLDINSHNDELIEENIVVGDFYKKKNTLLTKNLNEPLKIKIFPERNNENFEYSTSYVKYNDKSYSLTCEYRNYYSVNLDFINNQSIGETIIKNFLQL